MTNHRSLAVLPVFNEVTHVHRVLDEVRQYIDDILVVDDGSTDGTAAELARRSDIDVESHPVNQGYGAALRTAFRYAADHGYEGLVTIDCDGQHEPQRIPRFLAALQGADIVSGSRYLKQYAGDSEPPGQRRWVNQVITAELNQQLGLSLTDAFCGFKAYRVGALPVGLREPGYAMPLELWVRAAAAGLKIIELPVPLIYLDEKRSFGGALDDATTRLSYYRSVIQRSLDNVGQPPAAQRLWPMRESLGHRRLRAPSGDGQALVDPPLSAAAALLAENRRLAVEPWRLEVDRHALCQDARRETLNLALRHTRRYRDCESPPEMPEMAPWILAGHQPQLFHPGVWFKNFALSHLGQACSAVALNLIVDNDVCRPALVRVPVPAGDRWRYETVLWDALLPGLPYEEQPVEDGECFRSFAERAAQAAAPLSPDPLVRRMWPTAVERMEAGETAGSCLAAARHRLEASLGLQTLEVSLGAVFQLPSVCRWTAAVLTLPEFLETYNDLLHRYRQLNRVRSRSHPVPDLRQHGERREAPFWVWSRQHPRRRQLFIRQAASRWQLGDRDGWQIEAPSDELPERIQSLPDQGVRLRPRALMTTLFARTVLGDLFLHGIGGAKYDQLTDALMEKLLGIRPPRFITATATLRLRDPPVAATRQRIANGRWLLRELEFNPQRHLRSLPVGSPSQALVAEKQQWIADRRDLAARHQQLGRINRQLQPYVAELRESARQSLASETLVLQDSLKLASREHAFCLFDEEKLPAKLLDLCQNPE